MCYSETSENRSKSDNESTLPVHPFFASANDQASFVDCIDAIHQTSAVIELCNALKLDNNHGGLTPNAAFGYYCLNLLTRETLSYVSERLVILDKNNKNDHIQDSSYLSALLNSLQSLDKTSREAVLNNTTAKMNISRSALDRLIDDMTTQ